MTVRYYSSSAGKMVLQLGVTAIATAIQVDTTAGLPGTTPFTLLLDVGQPSEEVVTVTQVSGNTLVVIRGEDGTAAQPHANGAVVRHAISARDLRDSRDHENSTSAHGTTSAVVGVSDTQALTNKNLSSPSNTFPASLATDAELSAHTTATVAHGATGAVVGTTNTQTLTNKTINSPLFTGNSESTLTLGKPDSTSLRSFESVRLANVINKVYLSRFYTASDGTSAAAAMVLLEDGVEVGRIQLYPDGHLGVSGGGSIAASNIPTSGVAGTSTTKASKRLHWGTVTITATDASGYSTVTHGAGFTPTVVVPIAAPGYQMGVDTIGATTFRVRVLQADGSVFPGQTPTIMYFCGE